MKKILLLLSICFLLPVFTYAAIPIHVEKTVAKETKLIKNEEQKTLKKDKKIVQLYKKVLKKIRVPEKTNGNGWLNGFSFGTAMLAILLVILGSAASILAIPLSSAAIIFGIIGLRRGEALKGLGIAGIALGGGLLLLFILPILLFGVFL